MTRYTTDEEKILYINARKKDRHKPGRKRKGDRHTGKHQKGTHVPSQFDSYEFIAWDGEGATIDGEHRYILLMNSKGFTETDADGISTHACFDSLLAMATGFPKAIHVCYGASYDVNMMLKDIDIDTLRAIHKGKRVMWKAAKGVFYSIEYRARKSLFVALFDATPFTPVLNIKGKRVGWKPNYVAKMTLWDVFGFFGSSFLSALEKYFTSEELEVLGYAEIKAGKSRRSDFSIEELSSFIVPYTNLECKALVAIMGRLREYMKEADIKVSRWDGAGAVAAAGLRKLGVKHHYAVLPEHVYKAAKHAFSGGRIEAMMYGHHEGDEYHYDINSAYPDQLRLLDSMKDGIWEVSNGYGNITPNSLVRIKWSFPDMPFYPFFVRDVSGNIFYPQRGYNWVYGPEFLAAQKVIPNFSTCVKVEVVYTFVPANDIKPYQKIEEYYEQRRAWKAAGIGAEKLRKLEMNSYYGKTVQSLGYDETTKRLPPYFNLFYGGRTTSGTRAKLFEAAMQQPDSIISFATDGIWSLKPLDLPCSDKLGEWEFEKLDALTLVQSGVYWSRKGYDTRQFYRGFDKELLTEHSVLNAWALEKTELAIPTTRFITLGSALASEQRFLSKWRTWDTQDRTLKICATGKREDIKFLRWPQLELIRTKAAVGRMGTILSKPVVFPWDREYSGASETQVLEHAEYNEIEDVQL